MSTAAARRLEPDERATFDPMNALLDAFESQVRALKDAGMESQMRRRFDRVCPAPEKAADGERNLKLAKVLQALDPGRKRLTEAEFGRLNEARAILKQEIGIDA